MIGPFEKGFLAKKAGFGIETCPHRDNSSSSSDWLRGYITAFIFTSLNDVFDHSSKARWYDTPYQNSKAQYDAPDQNPKTRYGLSKPGLHAIPPVALIWLGQAMEEGRQKYGLTNWRDQSVTMSVYIDAAFRHLLAHQDGETLDPDSLGGKVPHLAKAMACMSIVLDAMAQGTINDDRKTAGKGPELMRELTKKIDG